MIRKHILDVQPGIEIQSLPIPPGQSYHPVMQHSPGFLRVIEEVRPRIQEISVEEARRRLTSTPKTVLLDVREEGEWASGRASQAIHIGKGILERDIESRIPDPETAIIMYCGGGYRSALTAEVAQRMGYKNVASLIGGYKAMVAAGWPMAK
jgi:rhodanese-related sulfurtransferase